MLACRPARAAAVSGRPVPAAPVPRTNPLRRPCGFGRESDATGQASSLMPMARRIVQTQNMQHRLPVVCQATGDDSSDRPSFEFNVVSVGIIALWAALAYYSFQYAPNQTPFRDQIFIKLLTGISQDENFKVNAVYFSIFNIIGIYTFVYQCLLIPAGRSANRIPAWPFVVLSYALGAFALLPYMALWSPIQDMELPPKKEELEGWNKLAMKGAETAVLPGVALVASVYLLYNALSADNATWQGYVQLFIESRLVHISSLDCCILATLCPFWMSNDAELRDWKQREQLLPILSVLPVVGPVTYLLLRPKTGDK